MVPLIPFVIAGVVNYVVARTIDGTIRKGGLGVDKPNETEVVTKDVAQGLFQNGLGILQSFCTGAGAFLAFSQ